MQVESIEEARASSGYGSAYVSAEDKMGSINDEFAIAREEVRWHQAREKEQARRALQTQSARSNPEREHTEPKPITFHPQPRPRPPQSARPAAAGQWDDELCSPARPRTSMAASSTFLTGTGFEERANDAPAASQPGGAATAGSHFSAPEREKQMPLRTSTGMPSEQASAAADEKGMKVWEHAERVPFHTTMDTAEMDSSMRYSRERWGSRPATAQVALDHMEDYMRLDRANRQRCDAEAREEERIRLTMAHYSQRGLPYVIRASADMTSDRLDKLRDMTAGRKSRVGAILDLSRHARGLGDDRMRQTIAEAICEDNKVLQKTTSEGRLSIAPSSRAAERVSPAGPLAWPQTSIPWLIDPYTRDWYRADKVRAICPCLLVNMNQFPLGKTLTHVNGSALPPGGWHHYAQGRGDTAAISDARQRQRACGRQPCQAARSTEPSSAGWKHGIIFRSPVSGWMGQDGRRLCLPFQHTS